MRAKSSNRYSANATHPDGVLGARRLCTATIHATTLTADCRLRAKSRWQRRRLLAVRCTHAYLGIWCAVAHRADASLQLQPTRFQRLLPAPRERFHGRRIGFSPIQCAIIKLVTSL